MNRRDFMKFAGVSWFSLFLPKGLQMATYTELMMKIADGQQLDAIEREQLRQYAGEMESNNKLVSSWKSIGNKVSSNYIDFPIINIFSKVFEQDTSDFVVNIPSDYNHLMVFSNARSISSSPAGALWTIAATVNNDTGNNYGYQAVYGASSATGASSSTTLNQLELGMAVGDDASALETISNVAFVLNYGSPYYKTAIYLSAYKNRILIQSSIWRNASKMNKLNILCGDAFKAGSALSIYGIK